MSHSMPQSTRPIGIVGNGEFSRDTAERLAASGQRILIHTLGPRPADLPKLAEAASTLTDIAFDCEIVLAFIDDSLAFKDTLIGTEEKTGLGAEMNPGAIVVDFGARPPRETQALLGVTGLRGIAILDAAIVAPSDGSTSELTILLGGFPDSVDRVEPLLAKIAKVERTGPLGSAHTAAALMGYMEAAHRVALNEAVAVGHALGLSVDTVARVIERQDDRAANSRASNIVRLKQRTDLALRLATDRGISADVIDFTGARLAKPEQDDG